MSSADIEYSLWQIEPYMKGSFNIQDWDEVTHILTKDFYLTYSGDCGSFSIVIKKGFITDGGSIPDIFSNIIKQWGRNIIAFLVHDALYATHYVDRRTADWILLEICEYSGTNWVERNAIYRSVRDFGNGIYDDKTEESINEYRKYVDFTISRSLNIPE